MSNCKCSCSGSTKLVLACSGASNVGQLSNEAAKKLDAEKMAKFYCLAGAGGHVDAMVSAISSADKVMVIDGCPVACAKLSMEAAGLTDYDYLVVTDLGVEKNRDFDLPASDVELVVNACKEKLAAKCSEVR